MLNFIGTHFALVPILAASLFAVTLGTASVRDAFHRG
ncbi:hypothetical protein SAMN05192580_2779 [Sphingomonas jatrophae]|uniref:Uncharacterized protein n=1 Tax=Sphingomonas jatrophae TaxID=1166337 RepID=A0A1I6LIE3_9SPHN|nr:hypothetical protein SAMN05192580_2779 [Sphingomonas jatrophae]